MRRRWMLALAPLLAAGLTGCGRQTGNDGVASLSGTGATPSSSSSATPSSEQDLRASMVKFAQCMRQHGVTMPDPKVNGGGVAINIPAGTAKSAVDKAQAACKKYLPNGGEPPRMDPKVTEQLRQLAKCMRANGVPKFPDPSPNGGIQIDGGKTGIDPNDPTFKAAEKKCAQYQPKRPAGADGPGTTTQNGGGGNGPSSGGNR
jgi:hypothetical protein